MSVNKYQIAITELNDKLAEYQVAHLKLQQAVKKVNKVHDAILKKEQKMAEKRIARKPCGFALPVPVSNKMCDFLGVPHGTEVARTSVTKEINNYIKTHNLQSPENKKHIIPDETLSKLLMEEYPTPLTHFNFQKFINHHFLKSAASASAASASANEA
jgi:chromatin remodeling complex protein RSC6